MKTPRSILTALAFFASASLAFAGPSFPAKAADLDLLVTGSFSIDLLDPNASDFCAIGATGHMQVHRDPPGTGLPHTIPIEMKELQLEGIAPHETFRVKILQGSPPAAGQIVGNNPDDFPTTNSFFDVFFELVVGPPGATQTLVTMAPVRLKGTNGFESPARLSSFFDIFMAVQPVDLALAANPNVKVAALTTCWLTPSQHVNKAKHGVSLNITGQDQLGKLTYGVCPDQRFQRAAVVDVKGETLRGLVSSNADCDEVFTSLANLGLPNLGPLQFEAVWDRDVRVPDWRGYHSGKFRIFAAVPATTPPKFVTIASGRLSGTHGVGTHRSPLPAPHDGEDCDDCSHFEGKLTGAMIVAGKYKGKLEATYAGVYVDANNAPINCCPPPCVPPSGKFIMTLDGVAVTKCLPKAN